MRLIQWLRDKIQQHKLAQQLNEQVQQLQQHSDRLLQQLQGLQQAQAEWEIHKEQLLMQLEDKTNETNLYESKYNALKEENKKTKEIRDYYNTVSFPDEPLELIEQMFKHADKVAINAICGYLKHDNQEMIKNLAKTMNPENQAMLIAYKDGAIGRNEALIKKLETLKKDKFNDRLEGTEKVIR